MKGEIIYNHIKWERGKRRFWSLNEQNSKSHWVSIKFLHITEREREREMRKETKNSSVESVPFVLLKLKGGKLADC